MRSSKNPFISLLLGWAVLVGTVATAQEAEETQGQQAGEIHFLVFAPNQFDHLHNAPEFQNGTRMISEQLTRSGLPKPNRLETIADLRRELDRLASVPREDRIVLFALTHGVNANGNDYLADQKTSRNGFLSGNESEMIAVSEIVETLGKSPAEHKWVLIDPATLELPLEGVSMEGAKFVIADDSTSAELLARYSDDAFGTSPFAVPSNFVVSINRGRRIHQSSDEDYVSSVFVRSFIFAISTEDRFSRHGQRVLFSETLDTMSQFLAADNHPIPAVSGSFNSDALLLPNRAESAGLIPISPATWQEAIEQEIETASKLILLYYRPQDAVTLLRQTEAQLRYLTTYSEQFTAHAEKARILRRMAQAMLGDEELRQAWQEAQREGEPFFLYVIHDPPAQPQPAQRQGTQQTTQSPPQYQPSMVGRLVRVSEITGGTNTRDPRTGRTVTAPAAVKYDDYIRLRLADVPNSQARKLQFTRMRSMGGGETVLPLTAFVLGNADPVSPLLESAFNREEFDSAP